MKYMRFLTDPWDFYQVCGKLFSIQNLCFHHCKLMLKGLGLNGIGTSVQVDNTPSFRGMVKKVLHLVEVEEAQS